MNYQEFPNILPMWRFEADHNIHSQKIEHALLHTLTSYYKWYLNKWQHNNEIIFTKWLAAIVYNQKNSVSMFRNTKT